MSIIYTCDVGWFISHENIINQFYGNIEGFHVNMKADLFKINVPYKHSNKKSTGKSKRINSNSSLGQLQVQISEEISFVETSFKNLIVKLEENKLANKNTNDSGDCNSEALKIAEVVYKITEEHAIKSAHGANMGNSIIKEFKNQRYLFPENAVFHCENVLVLPEYIKTKFDLIVLDPPWWNKYIRRKRSKSGLAYNMMYNNDLGNIPIQNLLNEDGLVVVWCTNSPQNYKSLVEDVFQKWDIKLKSKWYWIKVTQNLDPICNFSEPLKKQPFEQIIFGCKSLRQLPTPLNQKLVVSVPSILHSHKPPLIDLLAPYLPENPSCLELFARYLVPGWTSYGLEVLKFQHESLYDIKIKS